MEILGKFTLILIGIICSFLVGLLETYVIISIANLFKLAFITQFSFVQIYGACIIISLIKYRYKKPESEKKEFSDFMLESFSQIFTNALVILITWGSSFVAYSIIT